MPASTSVRRPYGSSAAPLISVSTIACPRTVGPTTLRPFACRAVKRSSSLDSRTWLSAGPSRPEFGIGAGCSGAIGCLLKYRSLFHHTAAPLPRVVPFDLLGLPKVLSKTGAGASADAGQLLADEHVDDATAAHERVR